MPLPNKMIITWAIHLMFQHKRSRCHPPCLIIPNHLARAMATCGSPATGPGAVPIITGYREYGCCLPKLACYGHPATGASMAAIMAGTLVIGTLKLASMVA